MKAVVLQERADRWRSAERDQFRACCDKQAGALKNLVRAVGWSEKEEVESGRTYKGKLWWTDLGMKGGGEGRMT